MQSGQIGDRLRRQASRVFVGRAPELARLREVLAPEGPCVVLLHGLSGIGKTSLLRQFAGSARDLGATVLELDGRQIEPTEQGFLRELGIAIGTQCKTVEDAARRFSEFDVSVVIAVDSFEVLRLIDTWLRQVFVPALPENVRLVLAGRERPAAGWTTDPGWQGAFRGVSLGGLSESEAFELLDQFGVGLPAATKLNRLAHGHPLGLTLGAGAIDALELDRAEDRVISELTSVYLGSIPDAGLRLSLEAVSVVRRVTHSTLAALIPSKAPEDTFARLSALPFVDPARDGLVVHDAVREAIATSLKSSNPPFYHELRLKAWNQLTGELDRVGEGDLWRFTADMLYLTENPVVREAFFPSDYQPLSVEPAKAGDAAAILDIARATEGPESAALYKVWWEVSPGFFKVLRDGNGDAVGFYIGILPDAAPPELVAADPVVAQMFEHLRKNPLPTGHSAMIFRKWLGRERGEAPSLVQAASWLDFKRTYVEMRRSLRRVYTSAWDVSHYEQVLPVLGFRFLPGAAVLDNRPQASAVLDFGPRLVHGWMAGLVGAELGVRPERILDQGARELLVGNERKPLTVLEFDVMLYLSEREDQVASRESLLEDVWGITYDGASNVVDVVIRSLRKKLGPLSASIETVRGVGYRFHRP